jgi:hypothetical protein
LLYNLAAVTASGGGEAAGIAGSTEENCNVANCYNLPAMAVPITGGSAGVSNCYFLSSQETTAGQAKGKTAAAFNSGEVSWYLNMQGEKHSHSGLWGLGEMTTEGNEDLVRAPVFSDAAHPAVYKIS